MAPRDRSARFLGRAGRRRRRGGQSTSEYMMLISVIVIALVAAAYIFFPVFQDGVDNLATDVSFYLSTGHTTGGPGGGGS